MSEALRKMLRNALTGRCLNCGRVRNKQGNFCCRMCRDGHETHSHLCRKNNNG